MLYLKYGYRIIFLVIFLSGCTSGLELAMNTIAGAAGSLITNHYEKKDDQKLSAQNSKNQKKFQEEPKRKVPKFDY